MRCKEARDALVEWQGDPAAQLAEHLEACPACRIFARDCRLISRSFRAAAQEPVPEATLGFAERVVRRLEDPASERRLVDQFLIGVGRRFIFAGLLATILIFLSLLLPPSGPLRAPAAAEIYIAQQETATVWNDPLFSDDAQPNQGGSTGRPSGASDQGAR